MTDSESVKIENRETGIKDPGWTKYFVWPWDYFPINLPGCVIEMEQEDLGRPDTGIIAWTMDTNLPLLVRVDDADGFVLAEVQPVPRGASEVEGGEGQSVLRVNQELGQDQLNGIIGLGFTWVFYVPVVPYVPEHPMGIVKTAGAELLGRQTRINIRDIRPAHKRRA